MHLYLFTGEQRGMPRLELAAVQPQQPLFSEILPQRQLLQLPPRLSRPSPRQPSPRRLSPPQLSPRRLSPRQLSPRRLSPRRLSPRQLSPQQLSPRQPSPRLPSLLRQLALPFLSH